MKSPLADLYTASDLISGNQEPVSIHVYQILLILF